MSNLNQNWKSMALKLLPLQNIINRKHARQAFSSYYYTLVLFFYFFPSVFQMTSDRKVTYLLTYSKVQSPSWEANWFAASQEIPRTSRNPKSFLTKMQRDDIYIELSVLYLTRYICSL